MFTRSTFLPLLTSLLTNSAAAAAIWNVGQSVKTSSGTVYGHAAPNRTQVSEYLAIPFAQPPIGNLRFNAPQSYNNTNASINSSTYPLNCPQNPVSLPGLTADQYTTQLIEYLQGTGSGSSGLYSEDCLYLNVWTKPQTGDAKKAVMMWFFPGGFRAGGTDNVGTNGQYYADLHDVIIVTFNYRVDIFGFSGAPGATNQNVGFLDQRMAVEWVQKNIAAFGGDPDRIIIWGESAGAAAIDYYQYAWTDKPIIAGSIMESGSTTLGNALNTTYAHYLWNTAATNAGCIGTDAQILSCMSALNVTQLLAASESVTGGGYGFNPVVDNATVFANYTTLQNEGNFIRKPILIGTNDYEAGWFKLTKGDTQPESYYVQTTLLVWTCVAENLAQLRRSFGIPSWRYRFFPTFPNTQHPYNSSVAIHTSEVPIVWGTYNDSIPAAASTTQEDQLSKLMMTQWAAFAKYPTGNGPGCAWPKYDESTASLALFGYNGTYDKIGLDENSYYDAGCPATNPSEAVAEMLLKEGHGPGYDMVTRTSKSS